MTYGLVLINEPEECQLVMLNVESGEETPTAWLPIDELKRIEDLARCIELEQPHVACQVNQR